MKTTQVRTKPFLTTLALAFLCISLLTGCGNTDTTPKDKQVEVPEKEPIQEIFDGAGNTSGNYANGSDVAINDSSVFYCKYHSLDEFHGSSTGVPYTKVIKTDLNLDNEEELIDEFGAVNNLNVVDDNLYAYSLNSKFNQEVFVNGKSFSQAEHTGMDGILKGSKYIETLIIQNNKLIYSEKELGVNPFESKCKGLYTCNLDGTDEELLVEGQVNPVLSNKGILYTQAEYADDGFKPTSTSILIKSNNEEPKTICDVEGEAKCTQQYGDNIYFAAKNEIYSVDFTGQNKEAVLTVDDDIAAFNIYKGILYYVDINGGIFSFNLETKETNKIKDTTLDTTFLEHYAQLYVTPNNLMFYAGVDYEVIPLTQTDK